MPFGDYSEFRVDECRDVVKNAITVFLKMNIEFRETSSLSQDKIEDS